MAVGRNRGTPPGPPPDTDVPLLVGGPGDGETVPEPDPQEPQTPSFREPPAPPRAPEPARREPPPQGSPVTIGGRSYTLDPEVARALSEERQQVEARLGELNSRYSRLEQAVLPRQAPEEYDWNTKLFENPAETLQRWEDRVVSRLTARYDADQQQQAFWGTFAQKHPDLADEPFLVQSVYQSLLPRWQYEPASRVGEFADAIADTTRDLILRLSRKGRASEAPADRRPAGRTVVEGASRGRAPTPPPEDEGPSSIAELLQKRRADRRRAMARVEGG